MEGYRIAAVERDTGLSKEVLRQWERRYGFPSPGRDAHGDRLYPPEQVDRLRQIRRLMDLGHRPGRLLALAPAELAALGPRIGAPARGRAPLPALPPPADASGLDDLLERLGHHDAAGFAQGLHQRLARDGLQRFVCDTVAPLSSAVGRAWEAGRLQVFEEHLFTELTTRLLRQATAALPMAALPPRVLLTTLPGEPHALGLLMVEALLALDGAPCVPLGTQTPLPDIARAARAHQADVVALSFSAAFAARQVAPLLVQLRALLPPDCDLWAGGAGVMRLAAGVDGVTLLHGLDGGRAALAAWRAARGRPAP